MLRQETDYSSTELMELLKKLKRMKLINVENGSRWDYLLDEQGNVKDKDILVITANDTYALSEYKNGDEDFYIYIALDLFTLYKEKGLNEKYFALYCLVKKWSQNTEQKAWMKIESMAKILKFDKDYINKMIYELNRHYFMSSYRRRNNKGSYSYEHYILDSAKPEQIERFLNSHMENMDKLIKRVDKKKECKQSMDIENELDIVEDSVKYESLAFGTKKAQVKNESWGQDNPFEDVPSESIRHNEIVNEPDEYCGGKPENFDEELDELFG